MLQFHLDDSHVLLQNVNINTDTYQWIAIENVIYTVEPMTDAA